jgi:hypothetical protein
MAEYANSRNWPNPGQVDLHTVFDQLSNSNIWSFRLFFSAISSSRMKIISQKPWSKSKSGRKFTRFTIFFTTFTIFYHIYYPRNPGTIFYTRFTNFFTIFTRRKSYIYHYFTKFTCFTR